MADYDFNPGGRLKLKGGVTDGGVKKKKSSKSKSKSDKERAKQKDREHTKELLFAATGESEASGSSVPRESDSPKPTDRKTAAERRFEEIQKQRLAERVAKMAVKTHKDRVHEFNAQLESLSEHHDIPKVGPG
ncbi:DUF1754-domain-containing protein [Sistotremastrum niveocremeum HHB9708]|uniref:DUF1754-domain-containing protein n=1 Tax=Sistotremastrum niveocremeum HHB9708 TaxID=1314777 RepID=A0A164UQI0_9AGAM|nr:DUF1754-domain-containing protein [Sistotremastrum niveocremeum HHB9708]